MTQPTQNLPPRPKNVPGSFAPASMRSGAGGSFTLLTGYTYRLRQIREPFPPGGYRLRKKRLVKKRDRYEDVLRAAAKSAQRAVQANLERELFGGNHARL